MLNWLTRYAVVSAELARDADGGLRESVLDVGCGPFGLSIVAPEARFAGIDLEFPEPVAPGMTALRYAPGPLPFADAAFDTVVCLDVLEHVPPPDRPGFVADLARVAARRVFLACPTDEALGLEAVLHDAFAAEGLPIPGWLSEHDEHGLPTAADVARWCAEVEGFTARELQMPNGLLSSVVVLGDMLPRLAGQAAAEWRDHREQWLALLESARFGPSYRRGHLLERAAARDGAIAAAALPETIWTAMRCACGAVGLDHDGTSARCAACGRVASREASGAWDLTAPAPAVTAALPRSSQEALVLTPRRWSRALDWLPALSAYIAWVPAERDVMLYLDARDADVDGALLSALLASVCEYLAQGGAYAAIGLMEGTVAPPDGAVAVDGPHDLIDRLGLQVPTLADDPEVVVEHARWVKQIVDAVQSDVDRVTFERAPRPALTHDSLVTVRIPTYGDTEPLVARAIPSVLAGAHRNLELLVCSDGPQPHARAAVDAIADPRVRYLELDARPAYPSRKESFWQVAGIPAVNRLLDEARGEVIAALDHDDAFTYGHIPRLIDELINGADFAYGQAMTEYPDGDWRLLGSAPLRYGEIVHATVMYSSRLRHLRYDPYAWLLDEPGDWNMWRRIQATGASIRHLPEPVAVHFKERSSIAGEQRRPADVLADLAGDVLGTPARELLTVSSRERGARLD